jgi:hypothetical protein
MHLSRAYPWRLDLSERELNTIEQALDVVISEGDLEDESHKLASHLLFNIRNIHDKVNVRKKALTKTVASSQFITDTNSAEELHESLEDNS